VCIVYTKVQFFLCNESLWLVLHTKRMSKLLFWSFYYQDSGVKVLPFSPPIYNAITHFWAKHMGQTMILLGDISSAHLLDASCMQIFGCILHANFWVHLGCMLSPLIAWVNFLFPTLFITNFDLGFYKSLDIYCDRH